MANRFIFIGEVSKIKDKEYFEHLSKSKAGNPLDMNRFSCRVRAGTNTVFAEVSGFARDEIRYKNADKEDVTIPWADRKKEETLKQMPSSRKYYADFGEENGGRKEFATDYDFAAYLGEMFPKCSGRVRLSGQMTRRFYNEKWTNQFAVTSVRMAREDEPDKLVISNDIYFTHDALDTTDCKTTKTIHVSGYIAQYIDKDNGTMYIPMQFNLNGQGLNFEDELVKKRFIAKRDSFKVPANKVFHMAWISDVLNGTEMVPFDESMLTDFQKAMIEMGENTIEDFRPSGGVYGDRITDIRLNKMNPTGDFKNGVVDTGMKESEFVIKIYTGKKKEAPKSESKQPETKQVNTKTTDSDPEFDEGVDDLFS